MFGIETEQMFNIDFLCRWNNEKYEYEMMTL